MASQYLSAGGKSVKCETVKHVYRVAHLVAGLGWAHLDFE